MDGLRTIGILADVFVWFHSSAEGIFQVDTASSIHGNSQLECTDIYPVFGWR